MTPENTFKDYGVAVLALTALIFIFKYVFAYLTHAHSTKSGGSGNGFSVMKAHVEDIANQMNEQAKIWTPEKAKQIDAIRSETKENLKMHLVFGKDNIPVWHNREEVHETQKELVIEVRKNTAETKITNSLLRQIVTQRMPDPWTPP